MISFSSVARAASTAAMLIGRPTENGIKTLGKRTVFLIGRSGSVCTFSLLSAIVVPSVAEASAPESHPGFRGADRVPAVRTSDNFSGDGAPANGPGARAPLGHAQE